MSEAEVRDFLERDPARPAILGATRKDGRPHLAPMWYALDSDGELLVRLRVTHTVSAEDVAD
ncbi:hypothetical protein HJ590_16535 [Naumannella sp. ID2617S]|nr:hypothetical protein [Naumannella sp. ID2617S]